MAKQNVNEMPKGDTPQDDAGQAEDQTQEQQPYLGNWKTREQAEEGLNHLQKLLDSQGNELGTLRKQTELLSSRMNQPQQGEPKGKPEQPQGPDYGKQMADIETQLAELDPDEPDYTKKLGKLVAKSNAITADMATQRALDAAQRQFSETLNDRDVQSMQQRFYDTHPDFNDPETQMEIDRFLQQDKTGMHDQMSAYFAVTGQAATQQLQEAQARIEELENRLNIAGGQEDVGKVVTKSQAPRQKTKKTKATGADLTRSMADAFESAA